MWNSAELEEILRIARRYDLVILSDEIHADLVYPEAHHTVLATLAGEHDKLVTAVAPSKTFNIPGLGLSSLIVPDPALRDALRKIFDSLHLANTNPFSIAAFEAAYRGGAAWLDSLLVYLRDNRDFVGDYLRTHLPGIRLIQPEGTYLLWLDCRGLRMNDAELRDFFVRQAGVGHEPRHLVRAGRQRLHASEHRIAAPCHRRCTAAYCKCAAAALVMSGCVADSASATN